MLLPTIAQLSGRVLTSLAGLVITTLVTVHLGPAPMGILGIFLSFQAILGIMEGGMPIAMNRAVAIGSDAKAEQENTRLFRAFEIVTLLNAIIIFLLVRMTLPLILKIWDSEFIESIDIDSISVLFGIALAFRFMHPLYSYTLFGKQKHFVAGSLISIFAILRTVGVGVVILLFHKSLFAVFYVLALSNMGEVLAYILTCRFFRIWRMRAMPDWKQFRANLKFMAPLTGFIIVSIIISQLDRIIISHFLSLEQFGAYSLIATYAAGVLAFTYAPINVFFPIMTRAVHEGNTQEIRHALSRAEKMILFLSFPLSIWACFYGHDFGKMFLNHPDIVTFTKPLWAPVFLATCFNAICYLCHKIFLSHNRPNWSFRINLIMMFIFPILLLASLQIFGYPNAVYAVPLIGLITAVLYWVLMSRLGAIMQNEMWIMVKRVFCLLLILIVFFTIAHSASLNPSMPPWVHFLWMAVPGLVAALCYLWLNKKDIFS